MKFEDPHLLNTLEKSTDQELDNADFGIVGMGKNLHVTRYNQYESQLSGLSKDFVQDKHFFIDVAPCMNNYIVSLKFDAEETLDESIDYVLSFKLDPTYVKLRLLKSKDTATYYLLIRRK